MKFEMEKGAQVLGSRFINSGGTSRQDYDQHRSTFLHLLVKTCVGHHKHVFEGFEDTSEDGVMAVGATAIDAHNLPLRVKVNKPFGA